MSRRLLLLPIVALAVWQGPARLVRWALSRPAAVTAPAPAPRQDAAPEEPGAEHVLERRQPLRPGATCDLTNVSGDVLVRRAEGREAHLRAVYHGRTRVKIDDDDGDLRARAEYPRGPRDEEGEVAYTLDLPRGAALRVRTVSGDLKIADVSGAVDVRVVSGSLALARAAGEVTVEAVSGGVKLLQPSGRVRVRTVSGDVSVGFGRDAAGGEIATVSGKILATAPRDPGLSVRASSRSGEVRNEFGVGGGASLSLTSLSGDIETVAR